MRIVGARTAASFTFFRAAGTRQSLVVHIVLLPATRWRAVLVYAGDSPPLLFGIF